MDHVSSEPDVHSIAWDTFDRLAAGRGGSAALDVLRTADRSRRLLLLCGLVERAATDPRLTGPLTSPEAAWDLLVRAQQADFRSLERILAHPYTGSWAGYTTRLIEQDLTGECPLWVHYGYLYTLAATAAIHAGLDFTIRVPVWDGTVVLPTLGAARLSEERGFTIAEVRGEAGDFTIRDERSCVAPTQPAWSPLRTFRFETRDRVLDLRLDDLDPHRGLYHPIPPARLPETESANWRNLLGEAWSLIVEHLPEYAEVLPTGLMSIVPEPAVPFRLPSASTGEAFGSAVIAAPDEPAALAAALVHEFQHIRLGALLQLARLHDDDRTQRLYAPWREDPRPLGGLVHGIYAFFGVSAFWRALSRARPDDLLAAFEFAHWRIQSWRTLEAIRDDSSLTDEGRRFLEELAAVLGPWQDEPTAGEAARWADTLAVDHHAGWRLRHVRPEPGAVAGLAQAWQEGLPCPPVAPGGLLDTVSDGDWPNARADLVRVRLGENGETRLARSWSHVPDVLEADHLLVGDRVDEARAAYTAELAKDPDHASALIGLGLSLPDGPAKRALLAAPELIRATHRKLRETGGTPHVEDLAAWTAEGLS
ncbi:HEXXH motif domain-containing protein [Amycolatopsis sp. Hca4]|uniref:HEXXH motif domain-containing protein n=1 Tax=Amycolatopsis sp. Hca4 TaxID=2742131 RepID=UPI001592AF1E|nr:HEXXH motif domain-containing protein [Amycolatopsis sp. Hca4]QKV81570.1 HEXXH motif domain-containing protein [Amycolatopsis sp. Hca4]